MFLVAEYDESWKLIFLALMITNPSVIFISFYPPTNSSEPLNADEAKFVWQTVINIAGIHLSWGIFDVVLCKKGEFRFYVVSSIEMIECFIRILMQYNSPVVI